jgi:hypothetical protein
MLSVAELNATDPAEAAERFDQLQTQLKSSERLNEHYNTVVDRLRLARTDGRSVQTAEPVETALEKVSHWPPQASA